MNCKSSKSNQTSRFCKTILLVSLLISSIANAIIIRHDVSDEKYIALSEPFVSMVKINLPDGVGTLISKEWVLTTAHIAQLVNKGHTVDVNGKQFTVEKVMIHPENREDPGVDIALIKLTQPVNHVKPVNLYTNTDELGKKIIIAGHWKSGNGLTGGTKIDGKIRAAQNTIDNIYKNKWISFKFNHPSDINVDAMEGVPDAGDNGGAAYFVDGNKQYILGVSSAQSTKGTNGKEGRYGVTEYFMRVSYYSEWIYQTVTSN